MAARGSRISRTIDYFREAPYDEARVVKTLVDEVMAMRAPEGGAVPKVAGPTRKRRARKSATPLPVETRVLATEDSTKVTPY